MLKNLKLSRKFNILLFAIFLGAVILSGVAFSAILNRSAEQEITTQARLLLQTMLSVRQYTLTQVTPELSDRLETETEFLPQTVPGYSAREVMENLRTTEGYSAFFYKEAALNPTNLRDQADGFETELIKRFQGDRQLEELTGYRPTPIGDLFYIARPIVIKQESCLRCHSTPEAAPKSQIASYGRDHGFGWTLNEVIGAQTLSVPASDVIREAHKAFLIFMSIVATAFALVVFVINLLLKRAVITPLNRMAQAANEVSMGNMEIEFQQTSTDEIGKLSVAFNRMKTSLVMAMEMLRGGQ